jgi:amino acid adenylation domain-containing protein
MVEPRTDTERTLSAIFLKVVPGVGRVSVVDDISTLGMNSMQMIQFTSECRRKGFAFSMAEFRQHSSIAKLADFVSNAAQQRRLARTLSQASTNSGGSGSSSRALSATPSLSSMHKLYPEIPQALKVMLPLSQQEENLWIEDQLLEENEADPYVLPSDFELIGSLDRNLLRRAVELVVARHDILRTSFSQTQDGIPFQRVSPTVAIQWYEIELSADESYESATEFHRLTKRRFNLEKDPLVRVVLAKRKPSAGDVSSKQRWLVSFVFHHIVVDPQALNIIYGELTMIYNEFKSGLIYTRLPPVRLQYSQYAVMQRSRDTEMNAHVEWWRKKLAGLEPLNLPLDFARTQQRPSSRGGRVFAVLKPGMQEQLKALAQTEKTTPFTLVTAVVYELLSRYCSQRDFCIGTIVGGRTNADLEQCVGYFHETVPMRFQAVPQSATFGELLQTVSNIFYESVSHVVPLSKMVSVLSQKPDPSFHPLLQVNCFYKFQGALSRHGEWQAFNGTLAFDGIEQCVPLTNNERLDLTESGFTDNAAVEFDMQFYFDEFVGKDGSSRVVLSYRSELFQRESMQSMLNNFLILLEKALNAGSTVPLNSLSMVNNPNELALVGPQTAKNSRKHTMLLHELVEKTVKKHPNLLAVQCHDGKSLTYGEMDARAESLKQTLVNDAGVMLNDVVAICMQRSVDLLVAMMSILKSDACYLPLDPSFPEDRLQYMLEDSQSTLLIVDESLLKIFGELKNINVMVYKSNGEFEMQTKTKQSSSSSSSKTTKSSKTTTAKKSTSNKSTLSNMERLAVMFYTSGSTGKPKGSRLPHFLMVNQCLACVDDFSFAINDVAALWTAYSFDPSVWTIFCSFFQGGSVFLPELSIQYDPSYFVRMVNEFKVCGGFLTASIGDYMCDELQRIGVPVLPSLKYLTMGGEALTTRTWVKLRKTFPNARIFNHYGPMESFDGAVFECTDDAMTKPWVQSGAPIGRASANYTLFVVDPLLQLVPRGFIGELLIAVNGLPADGYFGKPELSKEKFIDNPFYPKLDNEHRRLYRTGDLVKVQPDGNLVYIGRTDFQVKIRGIRIELGEIERVICTFDGVKDAVVLVQDARLIAFVLKRSAPVAVDALKSHCRSTLPAYMVPFVFIQMDQWPTTPSGKIDRKQLPLPTADEVKQLTNQNVDSQIAPRNAIEQELAEVIASILEVPKVNVESDLTSLGMNSLQLVRFASECRRLRLNVDARTLRTSSIASLARQLDPSSGSQQTVVAPASSPKKLNPLCLSYFEEAYWLQNQLGEGATDELIVNTMEVENEIDGEIMCKALQFLVNR